MLSGYGLYLLLNKEAGMANQLKMAMIDAIITLLERGWSYRRIARELGIHRETVARYDRERSAKPAISTPRVH